MLKCIIIVLCLSLPLSLWGAEKEPPFVFRVDWGSDELGAAIEQDFIVFSIDDLSILRPTQRDSKHLLYTHFWEKDRLRWALVDNFGGYFYEKGISSHGPIPDEDGAVLNIREHLAKRAYVEIMDDLAGCRYEFYKIKDGRLDPIFYCNSQTGECNPISPGDYLLVVSKIQKREPMEIRTFSITQQQIDQANREFKPVKGSPERFCGVIKLELENMEQASAELRQQWGRRLPRGTVLSGALFCYYHQSDPYHEYSFEYKEVLEYQDPLEDK